MVLDRKTVNTTRELISRLRNALKMELQTGRTEDKTVKSLIYVYIIHIRSITWLYLVMCVIMPSSQM